MVDAEKVLMHWANKRSLHEDIVSSLMLSGGVAEMEGLLPPGSVLGGYSAVRAWFGEAPADYSSVWVYHRQPEAVKERLAGEKPGQTKVMVLQLNPSIPLRGETTTLAHTFVDLWNMSEWMAKQFTGRVKEEIDGILS